LFLEVNIAEGQKSKLMIFEGDDPEIVVNTFSELYNLNDLKKSKLMEIVKTQMRNILVRIGETEEEDEETRKHQAS
jgi:hypothetical protein